MIDRAVSLVAQRLNAHLRARFGIADDLVVVSSLVDAEGKAPAGVRNRLVVLVTGITHDTMSRGVQGRFPALAGRVAVNPVPVHLNVHLMLASSFDPENYLESLKILSHAVQYFQVHPVLDHLSAPEMDRSVQQLTFEIENLDTDATSQLWGILGGRYMPSVLYRMRTVTIDASALTAEHLVIRGSETRAAAEADR